jgi:C-terminal processing protease CtpA/Prc
MPHPISKQLIACILGISAAACNILHEPAWPEPVPEAELAKTFTADQLAADLLATREFIEEVHPAAYERVDRTKIDQAAAMALAKIDRPLTRREFAPRLMQFLAAFGDGHTGGGFPREELRQYIRNDGLFLPFDADIDGEIVFVEPLLHPVPDLEPGDRLLAIAGRPIEEWVAELASLTSGPEAWRRATAVESLRQLLWLMNVVPPVQVRWQKSDHRIHEQQIAGSTWLEKRDGPATQVDDYAFRVMPGGIGLLDFRRMANQGAFQQLLQETFRRLRSENLAGLVVDLRRNGGGDSRLGDDLLEYLTDQPYRMTARKEWKSSEPYREFMRSRVSAWVRWLPLWWLHGFGRKFFGVPAGDIVVLEGLPSQPKPDAEMPLRWHGPCVFLIGPRTFSSALMLADAVKTAGIATIMGEETGECPTGFGEVMPYALPHTRLRIQVSSARFVRASGDANDRRGVVPDIEIRPSPADLRLGIDTGLEAAKNHLMSSRDQRRSNPMRQPQELLK